MEKNKTFYLISLVMVIIILGGVDVALAGYLENTMGYAFPAYLFIDIVILLAASLLGFFMTKKLSFPIWLRPLHKKKENFMALGLSLLLGTGIVVSNVLMFRGVDHSAVPWLSFPTLREPILLAVRAALFEEILFRFFLFSALTVLFKKFMSSPTVPLIMGALLSSLLFSLYHTGIAAAFIYGIALCYVYFTAGLMPAVVVHFLADAIPFTQVFLRSQI